jgi:poly(hydroxyalkanoate) depolymerase family esterase
MTTPFARDMAKATALTRSGKVQEATALIQSLLHPGVTPTGTPAPDDDVIDATFTRLDSPTARPMGPPKPKAPAKPKTPAKPRAPLAETLRKIAAGGMPAKDRTAGTAAPLAKGAQFLSLNHTSAEGSRSYRLYVPANRSETPMPLIVMLHGCTQTPEDFAAGTAMNSLAEEFGCMAAYPAQPSGANMQKCWNWYRPEDQGRDRGEPALIAGLTRDIQRDYPADPARTYVAGLSAGGAAAVLVAAAYPDVFSAAGVHSGLPAGSAHDIPSAFGAMRSGATGKPHGGVVPTIVFHGLSDTTVHPDNGAAVLAQAIHAMPDLQPATTMGVTEQGRTFRIIAHRDARGRSHAEHWEIEGAGHAWAGGNPAGSYTDASGPDASRQMLQFFLQHRKA